MAAAWAFQIISTVSSRIWNEVWNKGDLAVCDAVFSPHYVGHLPPGLVNGPEEFRQLVQTFRTAFPDVHLTAEDIIPAGEKIVVRWTSRGTHLGPLMGIPPTGRKVEIMGISIFRIADNQVAEEWEQFDMAGMMQQLGVGGGA